MNVFTRTANRMLNGIGIYPHDGKKVIFIRAGELHDGWVMGSKALTGHVRLEQLSELGRLGLLVEAANALKVPPSNIEGKLAKGEMVMYRQPGEVK